MLLELLCDSRLQLFGIGGGCSCCRRGAGSGSSQSRLLAHKRISVSRDTGDQAYGCSMAHHSTWPQSLCEHHAHDHGMCVVCCVLGCMKKSTTLFNDEFYSLSSSSSSTPATSHAAS
jgi:hypothetical protein